MKPATYWLKKARLWCRIFHWRHRNRIDIRYNDDGYVLIIQCPKCGDCWAVQRSMESIKGDRQGIQDDKDNKKGW